MTLDLREMWCTHSMALPSSASTHSESGEVFVSENLNAEAAQQINFTVTASDSDEVAPMSNSITATITVTDVN